MGRNQEESRTPKFVVRALLALVPLVVVLGVSLYAPQIDSFDFPEFFSGGITEVELPPIEVTEPEPVEILPWEQLEAERVVQEVGVDVLERMFRQLDPAAYAREFYPGDSIAPHQEEPLDSAGAVFIRRRPKPEP